jgi:hypothetical protein
MKIQSKFLYLFYLLVILLFNVSLPTSSEADIFRIIEIPIFPGGFNVKKNINESEHKKSLSYHVQIEYPAVEVLEFYDAFFNAKGWISSFEICQRHWDESSGDIQTGEFKERRLFASWQNPKANLKAELLLKYESFDQEDSKKVFVHCQLLPKMDH